MPRKSIDRYLGMVIIPKAGLDYVFLQSIRTKRTATIGCPFCPLKNHNSFFAFLTNYLSKFFDALCLDNELNTAVDVIT